MEATPSTVLVIEDDSGVRRLQCRLLERAGYRVLPAASTADALTVLQEGEIDLLLLDNCLSGRETGLEFYERLKRDGRDVPVILVTGFSDEATVVRALRAGARDFIAKTPQYLDILPEAVGRVLRQVRLEQQLLEAKARLEAIVRSASDAILVVESDGRISLFNPIAERVFGYSAPEAIGADIHQFLPALSLGSWVPTMPGPCETEGQDREGRRFPLEVTIGEVDIDGLHFHTLVARDIRERQASEARIREQAELLDRASDAIFIRDEEDRIRYWNHGAERMYGWSAAEAQGRRVEELLYRSAPKHIVGAREAVVEVGEWHGELRQVRKDGNEIIVESRWTAIFDTEGRVISVLTVNTDATEKHQLQTQYLHAQRMESVGRLAGGVAHDFNNLLTVINGYSELLIAKLPDEASRELALEIGAAGRRAAALTRQLLAFSRKSVLDPKVLDLRAVVRDMEKMLRRIIGEDIELAIRLNPKLGRTLVDPGQLEQAIVNLAVNARDAMPRGGRLTIETDNIELSPEYAANHLEVRAGRYVLLAVSDTGDGMDEEVRTHLFEPFFTTKERGKGTGLGLAMVYGFVKQSGGHIAVYSEPGHGTTFKIYLPREEAEPISPSSVTRMTTMPRGEETILLVEDEDAVRALTRYILESCGYRVLTAADGREALQLASDPGEAVALLLTDVVMPEMSGRQLAEAVRSLTPSIRVLYVSGYTDDAIVRHGMLEAGSAFLQKPFTPAALAQKVRRSLDSADLS